MYHASALQLLLVLEINAAFSPPSLLQTMQKDHGCMFNSTDYAMFCGCDVTGNPDLSPAQAASLPPDCQVRGSWVDVWCRLALPR